MTIITAWAENCSGPGWNNQLVWYIWRDESGKLHQDCLQPEQQTSDMRTLFGVSSAVNHQMTLAVSAALDK